MEQEQNTHRHIDRPTESLDAVVAAPDHFVIFENESVRLLDTRVGPGERVPVHMHQWPSVTCMISTGDFVRYDVEGNVLGDSRQMLMDVNPGTVQSLPPLAPHSIRNVGDSEMRAITVEIKNG